MSEERGGGRRTADELLEVRSVVSTLRACPAREVGVVAREADCGYLYFSMLFYLSPPAAAVLWRLFLSVFSLTMTRPLSVLEKWVPVSLCICPGCPPWRLRAFRVWLSVLLPSSVLGQDVAALTLKSASLQQQVDQQREQNQQTAERAAGLAQQCEGLTQEIDQLHEELAAAKDGTQELPFLCLPLSL